MPKVLQIVNRLNLGGQVSNVLYLSKFLRPEFETALVAGMIDDSEGNYEFLAKEMGIEPNYIPSMFRAINLKNDYRAYQEIRAFIREYKPDVVHTHAAKAGALGRLAAAKEKVPVIVHTYHGHVFHSYFGKLKTRFFLNVERYLARKSTGIIAISKLQKEELSEVFNICPANKFEIIPLGFNFKPFIENKIENRKNFRARYKIKEDEIAIGIVGRLVPIKNHELFLNAFAQLKTKTNKKVKALIIGDGELRQETEAFVKSLELPYTTVENGIEDKPVIFTSWIKDIGEAYAGLDVVALTSLNEGTPVSLIEAQAAGKAIVSTNVGGVKDVISEGLTGLLSPSKDVERLAENMKTLAEDDALRNKMAGAGADLMEEKYGLNRLIRETSDYYKRLLEKTP